MPTSCNSTNVTGTIMDLKYNWGLGSVSYIQHFVVRAIPINILRVFRDPVASPVVNISQPASGLELTLCERYANPIL